MTKSSVNHLAKEHENVRRVLRSFEEFLRQAEHAFGASGPSAVDQHELWTVLDYLSENLFMKHEEKEEVVLLPELVRRGLPWSDGALAHVRRDHRHGRYLMRSMRQAAHQARAWTSHDFSHFDAIGREWIDFLRQHMAAEEEHLFSVLEREIDPGEDATLLEQFAKIDAEFAAMRDAAVLERGGEAFVAKYQPI